MDAVNAYRSGGYDAALMQLHQGSEKMEKLDSSSGAAIDDPGLGPFSYAR